MGRWTGSIPDATALGALRVATVDRRTMTGTWFPMGLGRAAALLYLAGGTALAGALASAIAASVYYATIDAPVVPGGIVATFAAGLAVIAGIVAVGAVRWLARGSPTAALALAAATFVVVRMAVVIGLDGILVSDWQAYNRLAMGWLQGAPPIANWPMGYPAVLGEAYRLLGATPAVAEGLNLLLSGLGVALLAAWVHVLAGRAAAATAVVVMAVAPSQALFTLLVGTETFYVTALLAVVLLLTLTLISIRDGKSALRVVGLAVATGIALGASIWIRPTGLVIAPFIALLPLLVVRTRVGVSAMVAIALAFAVMLVPIAALNRLHVERWSPSTSMFAGWQLYVGFNVETMGRWNDADRHRVNRQVPGFRDFQLVHEYARGTFERETLQRAVERDDAALRLAFERIREDGLRLALILPFKYVLAWGPADAPVRYVQDLPLDGRAATMAAQSWWMVALAGAVWWFLRRGRDDPLAGLIVSTVIVPVALSLLLLQVQSRYHEYVVPLVAGLAAMSMRDPERIPGAHPVSAGPSPPTDPS